LIRRRSGGWATEEFVVRLTRRREVTDQTGTGQL
jgi:hypothetical protein